MNRIIVTGGAGFIGSALVKLLLKKYNIVINIDKLTYAGNKESLNIAFDNYRFYQCDISDKKSIAKIFSDFKPDYIIHLAAESHVDRSIDGPSDFIQTNIVGTFALLEVARSYWDELPTERKEKFRFHHVSTDEVYGSLGQADLFTENSPYDPSSPYSASKASSDHLVRAWHRTYGLPILITNCSNNYGPYQFPEKLIPLTVLSAIEGKSIPIYGDGKQIRDWLYVEDHAEAIYEVLCNGKTGETYNIGGHNEKSNLEVVNTLCNLLDELNPNHPKGVRSYDDLITFVSDRPGHDYRYAIDATKIEKNLGWLPKETFESGLRKTVQWYLNNKIWWSRVLDGSYQRERLGTL